MNDAGPVKFIVLTTQRSGATFFIKCLSGHPQIACRHETVFTQDNKFKFFSFDRPTSFYYQYRSSSLGRQLAHRFRRRSLIYDCIDDYFCTLPSNSKAIGFKLSYNHVRKYPEIADWIKDHDVRIVHFVRTNVFRTILSLATAKKRGVYHATQQVEPVQVHLDPRKLLRNLTRRTRLIEMYRTRFAEKPYLEVSYESFVGDRDVQTRRILQFLDIDEFVYLDSDLVKLNPVSIKDMLENYDRVVRVLEGTVFEKYLTM
jgi:LPS sulfotransferase NodH